MALITNDSLKAFLGAQNFLVTDQPAAGYASAVTQAESFVFTKVGLTEADIKAEALPLLTFCACAIFVHITSFQQSLPEEEIKHRENLFKEAKNIINEIVDGKTSIAKPTETTSTNSTSGMFVSNRNEVL